MIKSALRFALAAGNPSLCPRTQVRHSPTCQGFPLLCGVLSVAESTKQSYGIVGTTRKRRFDGNSV
jgi:hypothetical protein